MSEGIFQAPVHQAIGVKSRSDDFFKRVFDICVSMIVLILLVPFFGLIALAIKRDSPGPVIYRGRRMGRGGKEFKILKFRTMYETAKSYAGPKVTAHNDTRITNLGRWLRDTKINELPQFINVLNGDMSLVGPRPEDPDIAKSWPKDVWDEVLSVRPGITSPASVQYHNEEGLLNMDTVLQTYVDKVGPDKMRLDQLYVRYRSFWLDLDVLMWTAFVLLPKFNSSGLPEEMLFLGPITRLMKRYFNWFSVDLATTIVSFAVTGVIWRTSRVLDLGMLKAVLWSVVFSLLFSVAGALMGVNRISWTKATTADAVDLLPPWGVALLIALMINGVGHIFPTLLLLASFGVALWGYIITRYRSRLVHGLLGKLIAARRSADACERVMIAGTSTTAQMVAWLLNHPMNAFKFHIVGFVDENLLNQGLRMYGSRVLGTYKDIPRLIQQHDVGVVIMTGQESYPEGSTKIEELCRDSQVKLLMIPDMLGSLGNFIHPENQIPTAAMEIPVTSPAGAVVNNPISGIGSCAAVQNSMMNTSSLSNCGSNNQLTNDHLCDYCLSRYIAPVSGQPRVAPIEQSPAIPAGDMMVAKALAARKKTGELRMPASANVRTVPVDTGDLKHRSEPKYTGELKLPLAWISPDEKKSSQSSKQNGPEA